MSILAAPFEARDTARRGYAAAAGGRALADWYAHATSSDAELRANIRRLIDRSRDLERNNDYQRGFLLACERNVVGSGRYDLRMDCGEYLKGQAKGEPPKWAPDKQASTLIETQWKKWGKKGTCTVCGKYSWKGLKKQIVRAVVRDGNFIAQKIYGPKSKNVFGFALRIMEIDCLDLTRFDVLRNGNEVKFGVETDPDGRPVAYYIKTRHPGDWNGAGTVSPDVVRVNAAEIMHVMVIERTGQTIGVPWIVSAITRLRQLGMFEEAATIAARVGACKVAWLKKSPGANGEIGEWTGPTNSDGRASISAAPGQVEELPEGWDLADWSPEYPNISTGDFRKAMLRGVATSIGMSYTTIGNDLESVNFASSRVGLFEEREGWKMIQEFVTEDAYEPIFSSWLEFAILSSQVALPLAKIDNFDRPVFKARRWAMVDPAREADALKRFLALRVTSRRKWIEEQGGDVEDVFDDNKQDEDLAESMDLSLAPADPEPETFGEALPGAEPAPDDGSNPAVPGDEPEPPAPGKKKAPPTVKAIALEVVRMLLGGKKGG